MIALWPKESRRQIGRRVNPRLRLRRRGRTLTARFVPRPLHLRAIGFRTGRRTVTDRRPPYVFRQRAGERVRRLTITAFHANGDGPPIRRRIRRCGAL
jgi:hypothetical protein